MKILHVLADFQLGGGYLPAILPLADSLRKLNHSVSVLAVSSCEEGKKDMLTFSSSGLPSWLYSAQLDHWLKAHVKEFDIVHIHGLWTYPQFSAAHHSIKNNIPYIVSPHGIFMDKERYSGLKKYLHLKFIGWKVINSAAAIHVTSKLEYDGCINAGISEHLVTIPWGVQTSNLHFHDKNKEKLTQLWPSLAGRRILLYISRLSPEKGLDQLLISLIELKVRHKDVILVIAGEDDKKNRYRDTLNVMIKKYDLGENVLFTGLVQGDVKSALLENAAIFIMPSYGENFSFSIAEALASGTPVVTTTKTPWKIIEEVSAGRCVPPNSSSIFNALDELFSLPPSALSKMGQRGKKLINNDYDWEFIASKFQDLYLKFIFKGL